MERTIETQFSRLFEVIRTPEFLNMESLGGEIPFWIYAYDATLHSKVDASVELLKTKLANAGIPVLELNLYEVCLEILEEELGIEEVFELEEQMDQDEFKSALQSILDIQEVLMPALDERIQGAEAKVYFLTGIGAVFPFIRSHNILNNLQNIAKDAPTVAFFPGNYNGHSLELFGLMKDDNYYRAFNINTHSLNA